MPWLPVRRPAVERQRPADLESHGAVALDIRHVPSGMVRFRHFVQVLVEPSGLQREIADQPLDLAGIFPNDLRKRTGDEHELPMAGGTKLAFLEGPQRIGQLLFGHYLLSAFFVKRLQNELPRTRSLLDLHQHGIQPLVKRYNEVVIPRFQASPAHPVVENNRPVDPHLGTVVGAKIETDGLVFRRG